MNVDNIVSELKKLTTDEPTRQRIFNDYSNLQQLLSESGNASEKAAKLIVDFVNVF